MRRLYGPRRVSNSGVRGWRCSTRKITGYDASLYTLGAEKPARRIFQSPLMIANASSGYLFTINNNHSIIPRDVQAARRVSSSRCLISLFLRFDPSQKNEWPNRERSLYVHTDTFRGLSYLDEESRNVVAENE